MATWDVRLPKAQVPRFPAVCVGCGGVPTSAVKVKRDAIGWWTVVRFGWLYGTLAGRTVDVPACAVCVRRLRRQRLKRDATSWLIAIAGVALALWLFRDLEGLQRRLAMVGVVIVVCLPYAVWQEMFPPAVDITVTGGYVTFHFADQAYADEFATENGVI